MAKPPMMDVPPCVRPAPISVIPAPVERVVAVRLDDALSLECRSRRIVRTALRRRPCRSCRQCGNNKCKEMDCSHTRSLCEVTLRGRIARRSLRSQEPEPAPDPSRDINQKAAVFLAYLEAVAGVRHHIDITGRAMVGITTYDAATEAGADASKFWCMARCDVL